MISPLMLAGVLPQLRSMLTELKARPNVPPDVIVAADKFFAALERWAAGTPAPIAPPTEE